MVFIGKTWLVGLNLLGEVYIQHRKSLRTGIWIMSEAIDPYVIKQMESFKVSFD